MLKDNLEAHGPVVIREAIDGSRAAHSTSSRRLAASRLNGKCSTFLKQEKNPILLNKPQFGQLAADILKRVFQLGTVGCMKVFLPEVTRIIVRL